jgi:hypothetical protein
MRHEPNPSQTTPVCEIKGVTHAPAFRVHSTEFERVAAARPVLRSRILIYESRAGVILNNERLD